MSDKKSQLDKFLEDKDANTHLNALKSVMLGTGETSMATQRVHIYGRDRIVSLFNANMEKDDLIETCQMAAVAERACAVAFIAEAWMSKVKPSSDKETPSQAAARSTAPSKDPNREEVIFVQCVWRQDGALHSSGQVASIKRNASGIVVGFDDLVSMHDESYLPFGVAARIFAATELPLSDETRSNIAEALKLRFIKLDTSSAEDKRPKPN